MKYHHLKIIWAAFFLLCCLSLSSARDQKDVVSTKLPFKEIPNIGKLDSMFYRLDLANAPENVDLMVSMIPYGGKEMPKLFISKSKEFPETMDDADYSSVSTTGDVFIIRNKDFIALRGLYFGLICGHFDCQVQFRVEWTKEIQAIADGEKTIETPGPWASSFLVRFTIPRDDNAERITLHVDAFGEASASLEIFVGQGMTIPYTNTAENIAMQSPGFHGKIVRIEKGSSLFCTDCVLTLSLKFDKPYAISLRGETFQKNAKLSGAILRDGVSKDKASSYSFTGKKSHKKEDFILSVKVQQGRVKVYVDCDKQPEYTADYYWSFKPEESPEFILSPKKRSRCSTENYFVFVSGEESSVYSVQVTYKQPNQLSLGGLKKALTRTGELSSQEKVTFEILVPFFDAEEILLDLRSPQPLDLNITNCRFPTDCPGIVPAGNRGQIGINGSEKFTYNSEEIPSEGLRVKFSPKESGCSPIIIKDKALVNEALPACVYLVTLSNQKSAEIEYSLTAEYKGPNLLPFGESEFDFVGKNESRNYVFYSSREDIRTVQFQLTEFSGNPDIFVSRVDQSTQKPSEDGFLFSHEGRIIAQGRPGFEVYYVRVYGQETSYFSLSAIIEPKPIERRSWDRYPAPFVMAEVGVFPLTAGRPQKGVLLPKDEYEIQYYKILLDQDEDWQGTLRVTVNSLRGHVLILAGNNESLLTVEKNMWNDKDNELDIPSNDTNFKAKGTYYIAIVIDRNAPGADLLSDLVYHVTYTLIDDLPNPIHTFLSPNTPFYGAKKKGEPHYFETILLADQAPLTIYKSSETGEIDIYVSTDPNNKYPSADSYTETTKADSVTVKSCENPEANLCSVYIAVLSSKGIHQEVSYSLSMRFEFGTQGSSLPIALEDGRRIQSVAPKNSNSPAVFYYHAVPSQNSVVTVSSPGREVLGIYAKRIKVDIKSLKESEIKALKEADAEFKSQRTDSFITVPPLENSAVTIVAISVYFKDTEKDSDTTFTILASTQIAPLSIATPYTGFVIKDHYVYFTLNVTESRSTLLVSLTNIEGDADIVIGYGNSSRPTTTNNKFALLSDKKTEVIEINQDDLSSSESMSGIWVIGVYGDTTSSYSLTVVYEEMKSVDLKPNSPVEISLEKSSFIYLKYVQELEKNIEIKFAQISGQVNLYMTYFDMNQDFVANIPNKERNKFVFSEASRNMLIPMQSPQACVSCVYLMNVEAVSSSKFSFVVNQLDDILVIENGLEYERRLGAQKSAAYLFKYSKKDPELQLNVEMKGQGLVVFGSESSSVDHSNYLWDETLSAKDSYQIIPLERPTHKDSYYIIFENPTEKDLDYRFSINLKTVEVGKSQKQYSLDPNEKKLFEFIYDLPPTMTEINIMTGERNNWTPAFIDVVFYAAQKKGEKSQQKSMFSYLKEGQTYQIQPFPRGFSGLSDPVFSAREVPEVRSNASHAIVRQIFSGGFPEGRTRFQLEISNPWKFKVSFRLDIGMAGAGSIILEKTAQYEGDNMYSASFYSKKKGKWYLWAYTCSLARDLNVEDGDPEIGMVTIPKGGSYLYKEEVGEGEKIVSMLPHEQSGDQGGKFYLYSSIFDEKKFKSFDVKKDNLEVELSQQRYPESQDGGRSRVTAKFKPAEFKDAESGDEVIYQVQLCRRHSPSFQENNFCPPLWGCLPSEEVRFPAKQSKHVTVDVKDIEDGKYSAKIKATFVHKSQPVKFAHPYQLSFIDVNYRVGDPVKPKPWGLIAIFTGIAVLLAAVGFIALKKLRTLKENKGLELQKLEISSRGYNPLDEEGVTNEESKNEESKNEEKESPV